MVRRNKFQDWQINQANDALLFLLDDFLCLSWAQPWPVILKNIGSDGPLANRRKGREQKPINFKDVSNWIQMGKCLAEVLDKVKTGLRTLHYAYRTEQSYVEWKAFGRYWSLSKDETTHTYPGCFDQGGKGQGLRENEGSNCLDGRTSIWQRAAAYGVNQVEGKGYGF